MKLALIYPIDGVDSPLRYTLQIQDLAPISFHHIASIKDGLEITLFEEEYNEDTYDYSDYDILCIYFHPRKTNRVLELIEKHGNHSKVILCGVGLSHFKSQADCTITGSLESNWSDLIVDLENGELKPRYEQTKSISLNDLYTYEKLASYELEGFERVTPIEIQRSNSKYYDFEFDYTRSKSFLDGAQTEDLLSKYQSANDFFFQIYDSSIFKESPGTFSAFSNAKKAWGMRMPAAYLHCLNEPLMQGCDKLVLDFFREEYLTKDTMQRQIFSAKIIPSFYINADNDLEKQMNDIYSYLSIQGFEFAMFQTYSPIPGSDHFNKLIKNNISLEEDITYYDGNHFITKGQRKTHLRYVEFIRKYNRFVFRKHTIAAN